MTRHRLEPPPRVRARYGRIAVAGLSLVVTLIALLAGIGIIPVANGPAYAGKVGHTIDRAANAAMTTGPEAKKSAPTHASPPARTTTPTTSPSSPGTEGPIVTQATRNAETALPGGSGTGKRIVFDMRDQRVWLVDSGGKVLSSYLVSGSLTDNLHPGTYSVYSKSRWAIGVDDSGDMQYFVRFTHGQNAAIGFHSIPTKNGRLLETRAELGTPQSHGCIRQYLPDAIRLWNFAPEGTKVVVTA